MSIYLNLTQVCPVVIRHGIPPSRSKVSKNLGERSEPFNVGYTIFFEIRTRFLYALSETAPLRTFGTPA